MYFSPSHGFKPFVRLTGKRYFQNSKSPLACPLSWQLILFDLQDTQLFCTIFFTLIRFRVAIEPSMRLLHAPLHCLRHAAPNRSLLPSLAHWTYPFSIPIVISCHGTLLQAVAPLVGGTNMHGSILKGL